MRNKDVIIDTIKRMDVEQNGESLKIKGADSYDEEQLYTDVNSLKLLFTKACYTANGLYELIVKNCNVENIDISHDAHLEMYLSLAGLTCEIYLKSLIYYECNNDGIKVKTHKIEELFSKISPVDQGIIRNDIAEIDSIMPKLSDLFFKLRYDFELLHIEGEYLNVFALMKQLHDICNLKPKEESKSIRYCNGMLYFN